MVLHINPHVMLRRNHHGKNSFDSFFHNHSHSHNVHSFSASYSNVNGHVKRHFSQNGHDIDIRHAKQMIEQMDADMDRAFGDFGKIGNDFTDFGHDLKLDNESHHGIHPIRKLVNHYKQHKYRHGNLTNRIK